MNDGPRFVGLPDRFRALASTLRFGQFLSVGVLGALVDNLVLIALVEFAALAPELAKVFGAETAIIVMFVANERWTFADWGDAGALSLLRRFLTSNLVRFGGVLVALTVLFVAHRWLGVWYVFANLLGIGVGFVVNYLMESLVTWRVHR